MHSPIRYMPIKVNTNYIRPTLIEIHMADLHFGVIDPALQYKIYREQILDKINLINFNILFINGDLFDHKSMSNSTIVSYASMFVSDCVAICENKNASMIILEGTLEHDANQLKMFYHYMVNSSADIRIVETMSFHNVQGARILCIPELYRLDESVCREYLFNMGDYDMAVMHGVYNGAVYGNNAGYSRVFSDKDFIRCNGPVIGGHVHTSGCYDKHMYYTGSPLRFAHGQEEEKGFMILVHNLQTGKYLPYMETVKSFRYDTMTIDTLVSEDPKELIDYINKFKYGQYIDNLRIIFNCKVAPDTVSILKNYYRAKSDFKLEFKHDDTLEKIKSEIVNDDALFKKYEYLFAKNNEFNILCRYINEQEGREVITVEELTEMMDDKL